MTFGHLRIDFDARVLRPRPWTTRQSQWSAQLLRHAPPGPVLELCAGAGQIGLLALADERRDLVLVDVDETACRYARSNAGGAGLAGDVVVRRAALNEALAPDERFAFIIADPPWVRSDTVACFPDDPVLAIDGGADGLTTAWACLDAIAGHLMADGSAVIQLGSEEQIAMMRGRLEAVREPGLDVVEIRSHGAQGALALLRRPRDARSSTTASHDSA